MKKTILLPIILLLVTNSFSQVTIVTDDFDTPTDWTINTAVGTPIGSVIPGANETETLGTATTDNRWLINNVYHNDAFNCAGFNVGADDVPTQPTGIPNNNTNYLHITAGCAVDAVELNANWNASLKYKRRFFAFMNYDFVTTNYYSVNFSYWSTHAAGISVYYSTDGGNSWNFLEDTPNDGAWIKSNISIVQFDNQTTLRFGFLWDDEQGGNSNFPSIDALNISVPPLTCNFYEDKTTVCEAAQDTVYFTNHSQPDSTGINYSWVVTPGTSGTDWLFVSPTSSFWRTPQIQFLTANTYNVRLNVSRSSTGESLSQTDIINVISGCQCTSGGGTVELINDDPLLGNWTLTNSAYGDWETAPQSGNFQGINPPGNEAYLQIPIGENSNGSYADMAWSTDLDFSDGAATTTYELAFSLCNEEFDDTGGWGSGLIFQNTLEVYVSTDGGVSWTLEQTFNSNTGPNWIDETVDLSSYKGLGSNVRIKFRGIRSSDLSGVSGAWDMGLNDILLTKTTTGGGTGTEPTATLSLTSGTNPACSGGNLTFTCTATNLGGASVSNYEWFVDGTSVQTGTFATYTTNTLTDGQAITCAITLTGGTCAGPFVSDVYAITINETLSPNVWIDANPGTIVCPGTNLLFTAMPTNGGTSPAYQWQLNGTNVGTGATYSSSTLSDGDMVSVSMTSNVTCPSTNPVSDNYSVMIGGFNAANALAGTYTIETGNPVFPTLTAAIDSLKVLGVQAPVEFNIVDLTYNEQLIVPYFCGSSQTNQITFKSWCDDCGKPNVEYNADIGNNYTLKLDNTRYLNFEKINFKALGNTSGVVVEIANETNNIEFVNCTFSGVSTTGNSSDLSLIKSENQNSSYLAFRLNNFIDGSYGAYITNALSNISFSGSTFSNQSYSGIFLASIDRPFMIRNTISTNSTRNDYSGININYASGAVVIQKNKISSTTADGFGIKLTDIQGINTHIGSVSNNMVQIGDNNISYGIYLEKDAYTTEYVDIDFNSINLTSSAAGSLALSINNTDGNINVRNNILNGNSNPAILVNPASSITSSDYNDLYTTGANIGNWNGTDYANLAAWRSNSGQDANSISINPNFLSATDLHTENAGLAVGTPVSPIDQDFDSETRQSTPYIGADEYLGTVMWTGATDTDWNITGNWNPNTYISKNTNVQISNTVTNYPETNSNIDNLAECKNMTIDNGAHLYIAPNKYLTVWGNMNQNGTFLVQSDATGTGSFINKGSINYGGSSVTTVQRYITGHNWHYVSSPITNAQCTLFNPNNFYYYNETINDQWNMNDFSGGPMGWEDASASGSMTVMRGYATYEETGTIDFTGTLNTGNQTFNLDYTNNTGASFDGWNLVGNPYPSSLNWDDASNITRTNTDAAIYFFQDDGTANYNNYTYFIPQVNSSPYPAISLNRVSGCVPVSQGFFMKANSPGALIQINEGARIHNSVAFYKANNENTPATIKLSVENQNYTDETLMRFIPEATNDYDGEYDAFKLAGNSAGIPYIYTFTENDSLNLAINSLPEINAETIVGIGFRAGTSENFTIRTKELVLPENTTAFLIDEYLNKTINLNDISFYNFSSEEGNFRDRFKIIFKVEETSGINDNSTDIKIYSFNKTIFINIPDNKKSHVIITDISGKEIINRLLNSNRNNINMNKFSSGIYFVKLILESNTYFKKVLINKY